MSQPKGLAAVHPGRGNWFVSGLPESSRGRLRPLLEPISLGLREVVFERDRPIGWVVFPAGALISGVVRAGGRSVEVCVVGPEGFAGLGVALGIPRSAVTMVAHIAGPALRAPADGFAEALRSDAALARAAHRYAGAVLFMAGQNAACNAVHTVLERAAKWLLMARDRVETDSIPITQESLAEMLGVRRPTLSAVAERFKDEGLIRYRKGLITIADPAGLEQCACPCYRVLRKRFSEPPPRRGR